MINPFQSAIGAARQLWCRLRARGRQAPVTETPAEKQLPPAALAALEALPTSSLIKARAVKVQQLPPARPIPSEDEIIGILVSQEMDYASLLQVAMALELPVEELVSLTQTNEAVELMRALLAQASPVDMEQLASWLESAPLQANTVADKVRELGKESPELSPEKGPAFDQLVLLLAPLAGQARPLATGLGMEEEQTAALIHQFAALCTKGARNGLIRAAFRDKSPTARQWIHALTASGLDASVVEKLARQWQLDVPVFFDSWTEAAKERQGPDDWLTQLRVQHRTQPEAPLPILPVWMLVRCHADHPALGQVLGDPTDHSLGLPVKNAAHTRGLLCFLHRAASNRPLDWACLQELARKGCMDPAVAAKLLAVKSAQ